MNLSRGDNYRSTISMKNYRYIVAIPCLNHSFDLYHVLYATTGLPIPKSNLPQANCRSKSKYFTKLGRQVNADLPVICILRYTKTNIHLYKTLYFIFFIFQEQSRVFTAKKVRWTTVINENTDTIIKQVPTYTLKTVVYNLPNLKTKTLSTIISLLTND